MVGNSYVRNSVSAVHMHALDAPEVRLQMYLLHANTGLARVGARVAGGARGYFTGGAAAAGQRFVASGAHSGQALDVSDYGHDSVYNELQHSNDNMADLADDEHDSIQDGLHHHAHKVPGESDHVHEGVPDHFSVIGHEVVDRKNEIVSEEINSRCENAVVDKLKKFRELSLGDLDEVGEREEGVDETKIKRIQ
jgi:hypothetical protein